MYVLDTNVVSELRRVRPHPAVLTWISTLQPADVHIAGVTAGEIQIGIERTREHDPLKAIEIEAWLVDFLRSADVIPMTAETFRLWARFMHRKPAHLSGDAMIAATAVHHGMMVATRNVRDFEQFPVRLVNPFEG